MSYVIVTWLSKVITVYINTCKCHLKFFRRKNQIIKYTIYELYGSVMIIWKSDESVESKCQSVDINFGLQKNEKLFIL